MRVANAACPPGDRCAVADRAGVIRQGRRWAASVRRRLGGESLAPQVCQRSRCPVSVATGSGDDGAGLGGRHECYVSNGDDDAETRGAWRHNRAAAPLDTGPLLARRSKCRQALAYVRLLLLRPRRRLRRRLRRRRRRRRRPAASLLLRLAASMALLVSAGVSFPKLNMSDTSSGLWVEATALLAAVAPRTSPWSSDSEVSLGSVDERMVRPE